MCPCDVTEKYAEAAAKAVEEELKIEDFIERHSNQILDDLQKSAEEIREKNDEFFRRAFIEKALPIIDSVIHVGSSRDDYMNALRWAKGMPADPDRWLTLLTFVYIVRRAFDKQLKKGTWERIRGAIDGLLPQHTGL